ncbi:nucleotide exchange factor GrpE [Cohnella panacarvi]|uniref:nucleotide exchange factor GrpE n=1 Tax=Cohnella panacarvi TaxID=400776 RepID=UPI00047D7796|nr:nucleotide exchange factor GrpE [Cohnella panacarvi]
MSTNETKESVTMDEQQEELIAENEQSSNDASDAAAEQDEAAKAEGAQDAKLAALERLAEENQNRYLRAQADFDNFRRRTLKEKEELAQYATVKLVGELLPVLDNFQRALQTNGDAAQGDSFAKGVEMIYRQLFQVLETEGLKPMEPVGQPFDPEHHQAIMQVESDEYEEGIVVEVMQPGYWLKDKVIRPAMVKVSG